MAFHKFSYYLDGARTVLQCDHAPLQKFLQGKTLNDKVNNWGTERSNFQIDFQHIKGKCNVMADALSRIKRLGLYSPHDPEPDGREFGHTILEELPPVKVAQVKAHARPVAPQNCETEEILKQQETDELCNQIKQNIGLHK